MKFRVDVLVVASPIWSEINIRPLHCHSLQGHADKPIICQICEDLLQAFSRYHPWSPNYVMYGTEIDVVGHQDGWIPSGKVGLDPDKRNDARSWTPPPHRGGAFVRHHHLIPRIKSVPRFRTRGGNGATKIVIWVLIRDTEKRIKEMNKLRGWVQWQNWRDALACVAPHVQL